MEPTRAHPRDGLPELSPALAREVGQALEQMRATPGPNDAQHLRGRAWFLRRGFGGFGLVALALLAAIQILHEGGIDAWHGPLYALAYMIASLVYPTLRSWSSRRRGAGAWIARTACGAATLAGTLGVLILLQVSSHTRMIYVHWHGGYAPARYEFTVVDPAGEPIEGARLTLRGPQRPLPDFYLRAWNELNVAIPDGEGAWPFFELAQGPATTDTDGQATLHQLHMGSQYSGSYRETLGVRHDERGGPPDHRLLFTRPGFQTLELPYARLPQNHNWRGADPLPRATLRVVMEREAASAPRR